MISRTHEVLDGTKLCCESKTALDRAVFFTLAIEFLLEDPLLQPDLLAVPITD